ncbi:hypothetical protein Tco_0847636, partial [Tanacetum coccineum]
CMTRSSTKELFTPLENPERVFRSSRKLNKTRSLDYLNSPEFNFISNLEDQFEEKETKAMAETMEKYMTKTRDGYGSDHEDANEHIEKVLEIVDLFHITEITQDQLMLRAFPMSLIGAAIRWLRNEPSGKIQRTFDEMSSTLLNGYAEGDLVLQRIGVIVDLGASVSVMPFSTYTNLGLGELAHTKLTVELADRRSIPKFRERMKLDLEARLMGETLILNRSLDPLYRDYIKLNDLNEPLELRRNQVDNLKPIIEEGEVVDKPMFDEVKTRNDGNMVSRINGYPSYCDFDRKIHIDCAYNLQFSCMTGFEHVNANFFPIMSINVMSKTFYNSIMQDKVEYNGRNVLATFVNAPIFVGNFSVVTDFTIVENIDAYHDEGMGKAICGEPFCKASYVEVRRFDGMITILNGNDNFTYQMVRSHPRFKHLTDKQCNKIPPLLKVSEQDKMNGISHSYQKLKGFYKRILDLGPEFIRDEKIVERLTRGHISVHEMESELKKVELKDFAINKSDCRETTRTVFNLFYRVCLPKHQYGISNPTHTTY